MCALYLVYPGAGGPGGANHLDTNWIWSFGPSTFSPAVRKGFGPSTEYVNLIPQHIYQSIPYPRHMYIYSARRLQYMERGIFQKNSTVSRVPSPDSRSKYFHRFLISYFGRFILLFAQKPWKKEREQQQREGDDSIRFDSIRNQPNEKNQSQSLESSNHLHPVPFPPLSLPSLTPTVSFAVYIGSIWRLFVPYLSRPVGVVSSVPIWV